MGFEKTGRTGLGDNAQPEEPRDLREPETQNEFVDFMNRTTTETEEDNAN